MDIHAIKDFVDALVVACEGSETGITSTRSLIEPQFLAAFSAIFREPLANWSSLPPKLQDVIQNALHDNGWRQSSDIFEGSVERWIRYEIESPLDPHHDAATRLYDKLTRLPNPPRTSLERAMRQVYFVEFYHLRKIFHEYFTSHNREPLTTYLSNKLGLEVDTVRLVCKDTACAGERLDTFASKLGGLGALLLPHNVARTTLEKRVPIGAPEFDSVLKSLAAQGVSCNESTQRYYDLAEQFFSRRHEQGIRLAESLYQNKRSYRRSSTSDRKRRSINELLKGKIPCKVRRMMPRHAFPGQIILYPDDFEATTAQDGGTRVNGNSEVHYMLPDGEIMSDLDSIVQRNESYD